jgi:hypothetical protein
MDAAVGSKLVVRVGKRPHVMCVVCEEYCAACGSPFGVGPCEPWPFKPETPGIEAEDRAGYGASLVNSTPPWRIPKSRQTTT